MKPILFLLFTALANPSFAYFSVMDTGHLTQPEQYRVQGEGQFLMDAPKGFNFNGRFTTGLNEDSEIQGEVGIGTIDYYFGGFWKWVPIPDTDDQPAIGARMGFTFASVNDYSTYGFNLTPLASKNLESDYGVFAPYLGIPIGLQKNSLDTNFTLQATLGVQWTPDQWKIPELRGFHFLMEYGFEIDDAFDYFSIGTAYDF